MAEGTKIIKVVLAGSSESAVRAFEQTSAASEKAGSKLEAQGGRWGMLLKNPWVAAGVAVATVAAGIISASTAMAVKYDEASDRMAAKADITQAQAHAIGTAFLSTAFSSTFSAQQMMEAYGPVSGQLGTVEGHALSAADAMTVMAAATDLAEGSGAALTDSTAALARNMQVFDIHAQDASKTADILFSVSSKVNLSITDLTTAFDKMHAKLGPVGGSMLNLSILFLDAAEHGLTGKAAIQALDSATTSLLASNDTNIASLGKTETAYETQKDKLDKLIGSHKASADAIAKQRAVVLAAQEAYQTAEKGVGQLGLTVYDASGKFVGMQSVIAQLQPKLKGMSDSQRRVAEDAIFGKGAYEKLDSTLMAGQAGWDKAADGIGKTGVAHAAAQKATDNLTGAWSKMKSGVGDLGVELGQKFTPILTTIIDFITNWILPGLHGFISLVSGTGTLTGPLKTVADVIGTIASVIIAVAKFAIPLWIGAIRLVAGIVGTEIGIIATVIGSIIGVVGKVVGFIGSAFHAAASGITREFHDISAGIDAVWKGLISVLRVPINGMIGGLNWLITKINGITIHIHVGPVGYDWDGMHLGSIPTLDTGGIAFKPTLAQLSMNSVPEVVQPLPDYLKVIRGGGGNVTNYITIQTSADPASVVRALKEYNTTNGGVPIKIAS